MAREPEPAVRAAIARMQALRDTGRFDEALAVLEAAAERFPGDPEAHQSRAMLLLQLGRPAEGEGSARAAMALAPGSAEVEYILAACLLAQGRYAEAWPLYDARTRVADKPVFLPKGLPFPRWRGQDVAGKRIAIFPEQGFGDQIQFARFVPVLQARRAEIVLVTKPELVGLFAQSFPGVSVLAATGAVSFPDPDYWVPALDLAWIAGATIDALPQPPYLRPGDAAPTLRNGVRVGLMTSGSGAFAHDSRRSLPPGMAERLAEALGERAMSLDPRWTGALSFAQTAAIIAQLDLVIAVDTAVAHLAGALGKPCFVLLNGFATDWRWLTERSDSPWYPSLRLYRTEGESGWAAVIDRAVADAALVLDRRATIANLLTRDLIDEANGLRAAGRYDAALDRFAEAARRSPESPGALHNLAAQCLELGRLEEGEAAERRALALAPGAPLIRHGLAKILMSQGRYAEGWPLYRARTELPDLRSWYPSDFPFPRWQGEPLAGKHIALFPEQGLGDQIQFSRFVPWVAERAARVTLLAPPALAALFTESFPMVTVIEADGPTDFPDPDYWATLYDVPELAGITLETIPPTPYLQTGRSWAKPAGDLLIGLMTSGNPNFASDARRSLKADAAEALRSRLPGTVIDLHPNRTGARDFADTAALMRHLDLVVSVDTAVAHLTGALAVPGMVLIPGYATDWRWMRGRDDTPWYASLRLYRSDMDGNWSGAIDRLVADAWRLANGATAG